VLCRRPVLAILKLSLLYFLCNNDLFGNFPRKVTFSLVSRVGPITTSPLASTKLFMEISVLWLSLGMRKRTLSSICIRGQ